MTIQAQMLQRGDKFKESEVRPRVEAQLERSMVLDWLQSQAIITQVEPGEGALDTPEDLLGASPEELAASALGKPKPANPPAAAPTAADTGAEGKAGEAKAEAEAKAAESAAQAAAKTAAATKAAEQAAAEAGAKAEADAAEAAKAAADQAEDAAKTAAEDAARAADTAEAAAKAAATTAAAAAANAEAETATAAKAAGPAAETEAAAGAAAKAKAEEGGKEGGDAAAKGVEGATGEETTVKDSGAFLPGGFGAPRTPPLDRLKPKLPCAGLPSDRTLINSLHALKSSNASFLPGGFGAPPFPPSSPPFPSPPRFKFRISLPPVMRLTVFPLLPVSLRRVGRNLLDRSELQRCWKPGHSACARLTGGAFSPTTPSQ
jgi:hypothetical protein